MKTPPIIFSVPGYERLAADIRAALGADEGAVERRDFPDGEHYQRVITDVEGRDVVVVGGTVDDARTLCLYDLASALVTLEARRLHLVIPYFGYSTMERAVMPGEAVVAKTRARLLSAIPPAAYGNRALLLDLHSEGIPHYFERLTARHVYGKPVLTPTLRDAGGVDFVLGSTDSGRAKWVESLANDLQVDAAFILKRRVSATQTQVIALSAQVTNRRVVIYDDMIRTGGSLMSAARAYRDAGAADLVAVCSHGVFPGDAFARLQASGLFSRVIATDSHPRAVELEAEGLELVSVAGLLADHLRRG